jgi:bisphosphoglycerate-dependent phosphoglycerate mutase
MFKLESLENTHRNRVRSLEQQINDAFDESIRRMKISELETVQVDFSKKIDDIKTAQSRADIHTALLANGVIVIEKV